MQEITEPLRSLPDGAVGDVAESEFPTVLRGYDRFAVDAYVQRTNQLLAELQSRSTPQAAVRRALERVGEDVSGILQRAHETAEGITTQSRREAEDRLESARRESADLTAKARARVKELDADTDRIWSERDRIVGDARELARQLLELADEAAARFPADEETGEIAVSPAPAPATAPAPAPAAAAGGPTPGVPDENETEPSDSDLAPATDDDTAPTLESDDGAGDPIVAVDPVAGEQATEMLEPFDVETEDHQALPGELRFSRGPGQDGAERHHGLWGSGA